MIRWLMIVAALVTTPALGQSIPFPGPGTPASSGYQGPGDITSGAIAFYSPGRAYNAAYAAGQNPLADLVDTSTGALTCTLKVGTNGFADLTTAYCPTSVPTTNVVTWCTVTVGGCSITKLYDQTGNGNHVVQATLANMPALTFNAQNGLPCAANAPVGGGGLISGGTISQAAPYSYGAVAERTGAFTTAQNIITIAPIGAASRMEFRAVANSINVTNGTQVNIAANDSVFHAVLVVASGSAPLVAVDSSANTVTTTNGTTSLAAKVGVMVSSNGGASLTNGFFCEGWPYPADLNSSYQALLANMRSAMNGWNF